MHIIRIACLHCGKSWSTLDTYRECRSWLRLTRAWVTQCCKGAAASNFLLLFVCKISSSENNWTDSSSTLGALQSLEKMNTNCCERIRATNHKPDWLNMKNEHRRARLFESVSVCIFQHTRHFHFFFRSLTIIMCPTNIVLQQKWRILGHWAQKVTGDY